MEGAKQWLVAHSSSVGLRALALGQIISLLHICAAGSSSMLSRTGIHAPYTQIFLMYLSYTLVYGGILLYRRQPVQISRVWYLLIAAVEVVSSYIGLKAYQYTSITSITLLDCWTIPCTLLLTALFLRTRYHAHHLGGVAVCIAGLVVVLFSDVHAEDGGGGSNVLLGDALIVLASTMYAITNVSEEFVVKKVDQVEFLAHMGFFGVLISGCQVVAMESEILAAITWDVRTVTPFVTFTASVLAFSSLVPVLLRMSGATLLSLSMLTSDMWAVALRALGFHEAVDGLYFVAFGLVAVGLVVYASGREASQAAAAAPQVKYALIEQESEP